jgi:hypothetical protein
VRKHFLGILLIAPALLGACSLLIDTDTGLLQPGTRSNSVGNSEGTDQDAGTDGDVSPAAALCERCDDGVACTLDTCPNDGACASAPDDARCGSAQRCNALKGCVPLRCRDDSDCDDGDPCSGVDRCDPANEAADARTGCVVDAPPVCDDGLGCTDDACLPGVGCTNVPDNSRCSDGVECTVDTCSPQTGCRYDPSDVRCGFCQPGSQCDANAGCVGGFPNDCSDGNNCTIDRCDVENAECQHFGSCGSGPDSCETAQEIVINAGRGVTGGSFGRVTPTFDTACGRRGARDAIYHILIPSESDITIDSTLGDAATTLAVATRCDEAGFELACAGAQSEAERGSRLIIHRYNPQVMGSDLYVMVDAFDAENAGDYVLTVDVTPVADDSCSNQALALGPGATLLGFMSGAELLTGVESATCQANPTDVAPLENVVRIAGAADGNVTLTAESGAFTPVLSARARCGGNPIDELGCSATVVPSSNRVELDVPLDDEQEAFVVIDGGKAGAPYLLRALP